MAVYFDHCIDANTKMTGIGQAAAFEPKTSAIAWPMSAGD